MITEQEFVLFLKWALSQLGLRWEGFRRVRGIVRKRLGRRMKELGIDNLKAYRDLLSAEPEEWERLETFCLIPISRFYRDRKVYNVLGEEVLPKLARACRATRSETVNCLSVGCASGEEPYSLSIVWEFLVAPTFPEVGLSILAIDVDDNLLQRAHIGCYGAGSLKDLPDSLREAAFIPSGDLFCVHERFRRNIRFAKHDICAGVPDSTTDYDLILCRNVAFTYFDRATQEQVLFDLVRHLQPGGFLVVGAHERLPIAPNDLVQANFGSCFYRKAELGRSRPSSATR